MIERAEGWRLSPPGGQPGALQASSSSKVTDFPWPCWDATFFLVLPLPLPMQTTAVATPGPTGTASSVPLTAPVPLDGGGAALRLLGEVGALGRGHERLEHPAEIG